SDGRTVRTWLEEARVGIAGPNTAIGDAIGLAVKRLRDQPAQSRVLVLITDGAHTGGSLAPMTAAQLAAENGVTLYTIGIGALPGQVRGLGIFARTPGLDLDEPGLVAMAELTGGQYFRAHSSEALREIGATLDRLQPVAQQDLPLRRTEELYAWPLAAALLLALLLAVRVIRPLGSAPYWLRRSRRWPSSGPPCCVRPGCCCWCPASGCSGACGGGNGAAGAGNCCCRGPSTLCCCRAATPAALACPGRPSAWPGCWPCWRWRAPAGSVWSRPAPPAATPWW